MIFEACFSKKANKKGILVLPSMPPLITQNKTQDNLRLSLSGRMLKRYAKLKFAFLRIF
jgi:hypothetical protein